MADERVAGCALVVQSGEDKRVLGGLGMDEWQRHLRNNTSVSTMSAHTRMHVVWWDGGRSEIAAGLSSGNGDRGHRNSAGNSKMQSSSQPRVHTAVCSVSTHYTHAHTHTRTHETDVPWRQKKHGDTRLHARARKVDVRQKAAAMRAMPALDGACCPWWMMAHAVARGVDVCVGVARGCVRVATRRVRAPAVVVGVDWPLVLVQRTSVGMSNRSNPSDVSGSK